MKKALKKIWHWLDDRAKLTQSFRPIFKHLVPPGSKWSYVFGTATLFCFLLQVVTGIALATMYQPSVATAYDSLQYIQNEAILGKTLRGLHAMGASGMIVMVGIHMIRVYITAAYKFPRELNWISGVFLLLLTIVMGFTGQLLRWDDNGIWSTIVAAEQMGRIPFVGRYVAFFLLAGDTVNGHTLTRFFSYHVFIVPALLFTFIGFHLYLIIKNGISEPPKKGRPVDPKTYRSWYKDLLQRKGVPFFPNAAWRDVVFSTVVLIIIFCLAIFIGAPKLEAPPDPTYIQSNPKPDWYLTWIFALYALMPKQLEQVLIFFAPLIGITLLFALPLLSNKGERSPIKRPWAIAGVLLTATFVGTLTYVGTIAPWSPDFNTTPITQHIIFPQKITPGADLFYKKGCQYCHKIYDYGGKTGPDLTKVALRLDRQQMTIRILNGSKDMPAFGSSLTDEELNHILDFLGEMNGFTGQKRPQSTKPDKEAKAKQEEQIQQAKESHDSAQQQERQEDVKNTLKENKQRAEEGN